MFKRLILSKTMCSFIQETASTHLSLEYLWVLIIGVSMVIVNVKSSWSHQVAILANAFLHVSHLFVQQTQHQHGRVRVGLMTQDVVLNTTSVVYCLPYIGLRYPRLGGRNIDVILSFGKHAVEHALEGAVIGRGVVTDVVRRIAREVNGVYRTSVYLPSVVYL